MIHPPHGGDEPCGQRIWAFGAAGTPVLCGLDFEVAPGCVTALLGPSGCGKTTLMRAVVGLQAVSGGPIETSA